MKKSKFTKLLCVVLSLMTIMCATLMTAFAGTYSFSSSLFNLRFSVVFNDLENYRDYRNVYVLTQDKFEEWKDNYNTLEKLADASFIIAEMTDDGGTSLGVWYYLGTTYYGSFSKLPLNLYTFEWPVNPGIEQTYYIVLPGADGYYTYSNATGLIDGSNGYYSYVARFEINGTNGLTKYGLCPHTNASEGTFLAPTCGTAGHTAGVYCPDCEKWTEEQKEIPATGNHIDVDGDFFCDVCEYFDEAAAIPAARIAAINALHTAAGNNPSGEVAYILRQYVDAVIKLSDLTFIKIVENDGIKEINKQLAKEALAAAKADAKNAVNALADVTASNEVKAIITKALEDIEYAGTIEAVKAVVSAAAKDVADKLAAEAAARTLAEAKEAARAAINAEVGNDTSEKVKAAAEEAGAAIDNAKTLADVETAKNNGIQKIKAAKDDGNSYRLCTESINGICNLYNRYIDIPVINAFFAVVHAIIHGFYGIFRR